MSDGYVSIEEREATYFSLLEAFPDAAVAAIRDALFVPMPAGVPLRGQRYIDGDNPLDLVGPDEVDRMMRLWVQAEAHGLGKVSVHWTGRPDELSTIVVVDLQERFGAYLGICIPASEDGEPQNRIEREAGPPRVSHVTKNIQAVIGEVDAAFTAMLGWEPHEVLGARTADFAHPDDLPAIVENWLTMIGGEGEKHRTRIRHRRKDGTYAWVDMANWLVGDDVVASELVDVSNEMRALHAAWERQQLIDQLADALPLGVFQIDLHRRLVYTNARLHEILGTPPCDTLRQQFAKVLRRDWNAVSAVLDSLLVDGLERELPVNLVVGGEQRECVITFRALRDEDGELSGAVAGVNDVTQQMRLQHELEMQATLDHLTGCRNRAAAFLALADLLAADEVRAGVGLIFVDLDGFKAVNDDFGHAAGDELLRFVAERLRAAARRQDVVGRFGGDEFVVVCPDVGSTGEVMIIAERIAEALHTDVTLNVGPVSVRASIGVTWTNRRHRDATHFVGEADAAMYESKHQRAGRPVLFGREVAFTRTRRVGDEELLRHAVSHGDLTVRYQPIISMATGEVHGYEALLRWQRGDRLIAAGEFIELAERTGLIHEIDAWVIDEVCRTAATMAAAGVPVAFWTINVSPLELTVDGLAATVGAAVDRHGVDPASIVIEVTEHESLHRCEPALATMSQLAARGVRFALDDFGTGWSSFELLMALPVACVKVPRQFTEAVVDDLRARAIVASMIGVSAALDAFVIVEGIETEAERELARDLGAGFGQGWLFARPVPPDRLLPSAMTGPAPA